MLLIKKRLSHKSKAINRQARKGITPSTQRFNKHCFTLRPLRYPERNKPKDLCELGGYKGLLRHPPQKYDFN
jgi:hypothetical protein